MDTDFDVPLIVTDSLDNVDTDYSEPRSVMGGDRFLAIGHMMIGADRWTIMKGNGSFKWRPEK